ncbi:FAD-dependent oxidoreductase [Kerstersia gyiorum]|nr:FAD-dependent oxidoreductase [Kerstersia gyiorum]MCH4270621.1 FAD-dependent oxidoreductase [Kerstersia gyiorum]MCI1230042.1 FAD-dependent oxidoreductase [Kerstersia gyiorum]
MNAWGLTLASQSDQPPRLQGSGKGKRVLILGAGIAGLTSAYELRKAGYDCMIVEARPIAGGRARAPNPALARHPTRWASRNCWVPGWGRSTNRYRASTSRSPCSIRWKAWTRFPPPLHGSSTA